LDILVKNGTVLTMDEKGSVIPNGYVAVRGDAIAALGAGDGKEIHAKKTIDARGGLILPGLINCHTHAAMTLFRGLADDLPLMEWLDPVHLSRGKQDGRRFRSHRDSSCLRGNDHVRNHHVLRHVSFRGRGGKSGRHGGNAVPCGRGVV
jgi:hypothetical protein